MIGVWAVWLASMRPSVTGRSRVICCDLASLGCFWPVLARWWSEHGGSGFETARCAAYRRYRAGRRLSRRISASPRLYRTWRQAALVLVQHRAHRSSLRGSARRQCAVPAALRRHDGFNQPDSADATNPADRNLQSCGPEPCRRQLRKPGIYRQCRRDRRAAVAGSDPDSRHGEGDAVLSGIHLRVVRTGAGGSAEGDDAVLSALALWRREALWLLDHGELPRGLRHVRLEWHPVQS